jgi:hypothetical protein
MVDLAEEFMAASMGLSARIHFARPLAFERTSKSEAPSTSTIEKMEDVQARQLVGSSERPIIALRSVDLPALMVATTATEYVRSGTLPRVRLLVLCFMPYIIPFFGFFQLV